MPSMAKIREEMLDCIPDDPISLVDLGSGWGGVLQLLSRRYPSKRIIGYEVSWFPYLFSKWICRNQNIEVYRTNYLTVTLPKDAVFLCYLCPASMIELAKSPPKSGWLISHTFALPDHTPISTHVCMDMYRTHIYVYRFVKE